MPNILPVSDLRNYNEVLKKCQVGEPVFLTKNGRGRFEGDTKLYCCFEERGNQKCG